jgi:hypothetical protein
MAGYVSCNSAANASRTIATSSKSAFIGVFQTGDLIEPRPQAWHCGAQALTGHGGLFHRRVRRGEIDRLGDVECFGALGIGLGSRCSRSLIDLGD